MKKIILLVSIVFVFYAVKAQNVQKLTHDPEAKKILDKLSAKTKSYKTVRIKFSYTMENLRENFSETHKGYAFMKGKKYKLLIPGTEIFSDGKTVWRYLKDAEEMTISVPGEEDESIFNPAKLFTIYESGFKYKYLGNETVDNVKFDIIDLFPEKPGKKDYSRIRLKINNSKLLISSIKTFGKSGNNFVINVLEFKPGVKISDNLFVFDKKKYPKDIDIIDARD